MTFRMYWESREEAARRARRVRMLTARPAEGVRGGMVNSLDSVAERSPSPVYGAGLLNRLGFAPLGGSNPPLSAPCAPCCLARWPRQLHETPSAAASAPKRAVVGTENAHLGAAAPCQGRSGPGSRFVSYRAKVLGGGCRSRCRGPLAELGPRCRCPRQSGSVDGTIRSCRRPSRSSHDACDSGAYGSVPASGDCRRAREYSEIGILVEGLTGYC